MLHLKICTQICSLFINLSKKKILRTKDFTIQVTYPSHVTFSKIEVKINGFGPLRGLAVFLFTSCIDRYIQKNIFSFHKFYQRIDREKEKRKTFFHCSEISSSDISTRITYLHKYCYNNYLPLSLYRFTISRISIFRIQATVSCQMQFISAKSCAICFVSSFFSIHSSIKSLACFLMQREKTSIS